VSNGSLLLNRSSDQYCNHRNTRSRLRSVDAGVPDTFAENDIAPCASVAVVMLNAVSRDDPDFVLVGDTARVVVAVGYLAAADAVVRKR
jgi:hypothetical protein